MIEALDWTENNLEGLLGMPESARLEFKSVKLLSKSNDEIADDLSRQVSAFANSEGGVIVIGIDEEKSPDSKARVASALDGIKRDSTWTSERLQQVIDSSVSPYLPGIRLKRIPLPSVGDGTTVAVVVVIPKGSTAFQARNHIYYGRSEFEVKPLPDHEIRLRMMRGRAPSAKLHVFDFKQIQQAADKQAAYQEEVERVTAGITDPQEKVIAILDGPGFRSEFYDVYFMSLGVINTGEVSLRDFELVIRISCSGGIVVAEGDNAGKSELKLSTRLQLPTLETHHEFYSIRNPERVVFPQGVHTAFPDIRLSVPMKMNVLDGAPRIDWSIYLDDAFPNSGQIELAREFERFRANGAA